MKKNTAEQEKFKQLRFKAEELIKTDDFVSPPADFENQKRLIHELQVFQVELELQNEELRCSQQELMGQKKLYTELYDFAPVGYITVNLKGLILNANLTFADMLSTERSSLISQPLPDHIIFKDQDIYYRHLRELTVSKTRQVCELCMEKKDGIQFDVQLESTVISEDSGEPLQYRTVVIDISERKQMVKELAKHRDHLEELVKNRTFELQQEIIERKQAQKGRERLLKQLKEALENVKTLNGLLPICSQCKKIRDDEGYWNQIEGYIQKYSHAKFTHSMCPECADLLYGKEPWYLSRKKK